MWSLLIHSPILLTSPGVRLRVPSLSGHHHPSWSYSEVHQLSFHQNKRFYRSITTVRRVLCFVFQWYAGYKSYLNTLGFWEESFGNVQLWVSVSKSSVSKTQGQEMVHQSCSPPTMFQHILPAILKPRKSPESLGRSFPTEDGVWNQSWHPTYSVPIGNLQKYSSPLPQNCFHIFLNPNPSKAF